ncbi:aldo/keto reductase [Rossellomorea vietnamensis]|uniref:aldo/keto reductase n=1 Tax=Rossellomorea vietnamensis TaxID=218284 RepID=UPI001E52272F|nr:aldo/keto reductase [Rossellomorea vietnamensis]MCC5801773.1 aldo/keto reductase [Rossellomorea vietnamensis]
MKYKTFTAVEEELSVLGLGTWQFSGSDDWAQFNRNEAIKIVHQALDRGINFIDTAPVYGLGHAETVVGESIKGRRNNVFLATKVGLAWDGNNEVRNDLTPKNIFKEMDDSLTRLQVDYVDLYQIHWPDPGTDIRESMQALAELKQQGKIRYIGVSNFSVELMKQAMEVTDVVSHQGLYNMLEQNPESYHSIPLDYRVKDSLLPFLKEHRQLFLPYSPLMQGLLAGKSSFNTGVTVHNPMLQGLGLNHNLHKAEAIEAEVGKPIHEIALNWLISQEQVGPVIAGATKIEHLEKNLDSLSWEMDSTLFNSINEVVERTEG